MTGVTFYCACGDLDCPLQMHVVWTEDVLVHIMDMHGRDDRQTFAYAEFVTLLEEMFAHPCHDDVHDIYTYDLKTPLRHGIDTFHLFDRNYNFLIQLTKDIISADAAL